MARGAGGVSAYCPSMDWRVNIATRARPGPWPGQRLPAPRQALSRPPKQALPSFGFGPVQLEGQE